MSSLNELLRNAGPLKDEPALFAKVARAMVEADPPPARVAWRFTVERDEFGQIESLWAETVSPLEVPEK